MKTSLKKPLTIVLYLAILIAGIFAALQIRQFVLNRGEPSQNANPAQFLKPTTAPESAAANDGDEAVNPMKLTTMPARAGGMEPFNADPEGIAPPAGARATAGYQQRAYHAIRQQRVYECDTTPKAAADHYRQALAARGFVEVSSMPESGGLSLSYSSGNVHISVTISALKATGKTRVTVVSSKEE